MVNEWRPNEQHNRYMNDPTFLEERFGLQPLVDLLEDGVFGVARFIVMPSFDGESIYTFIYRADILVLQSAIAKRSLWCSLTDGTWSRPTQRTRSLALDQMPHPLQQWSLLKDAAHMAPSVSTAIIDGLEYATCDGISFRHRIQDHHDAIDAEWSNPTPEASNHVSQMILIDAYEAVLSNA